MVAVVKPSVPLAAVDPLRGAPRVTIALAARQSLYHLPLTLAEHLGYFRQAGISVEWLAHESGATPLVVLTKVDLAADPQAVARQLAAVAPGVGVESSSSISRSVRGRGVMRKLAGSIQAELTTNGHE